MKVFLPFLIICLLCTGCTRTNQQKALYLERELALTSPLTTTFDSLLQEARTLPISPRISVLLNFALRDEKEPLVSAKQEIVLLEVFPLASKREKKRILFRLIEIYNNQIHYNLIPYVNTKALARCNELESAYTLSQEERWRIIEVKAFVMNRVGNQAVYMPLWFQLLAEHRQADKPVLVINDLCIIATNLAALGDPEKALATYKEAYKLSITHKLTEQRNKCLNNIIELASELGRSEEVLGYYQQVGIDSIAVIKPAAYEVLAENYVRLGKPDSARIYFKKNLQVFPYSQILSYCRIAQTFTNEQCEDSATTYFAKAIEQHQTQTARVRKKNLKPSLPRIFLEVYPSFATLLLHNGKTQEAGEAFALTEPLTKKPAALPIEQKVQIDALTRYAAYCQATRQYEKGVELMLRCDSLRNVYDANREKRTSTSIVERFKMQELFYTIDLQKAKLSYSQRVLIAIAGASLILLSAIAVLARLYRQRRRQLSAIISKDREIEQLRQAASGSMPAASTLSPAEELFRAAEQRVTSEKLFLNKELSLELLARDLGTNRTYLSACVNTCSGGNFNQWINNYRIAYVLERIDTAPNLLQLASEAGFLSPDSFYRNFKRCTQMTTSQYLKEKGKTPD